MDIKSEFEVKEEFLLSADNTSNVQDIQLEESQERKCLLHDDDDDVKSRIEIKDEPLDIKEETQNDQLYDQLFDESQTHFEDGNTVATDQYALTWLYQRMNSGTNSSNPALSNPRRRRGRPKRTSKPRSTKVRMIKPKPRTATEGLQTLRNNPVPLLNTINDEEMSRRRVGDHCSPYHRITQPPTNLTDPQASAVHPRNQEQYLIATLIPGTYIYQPFQSQLPGPSFNGLPFTNLTSCNVQNNFSQNNIKLASPETSNVNHKNCSNTNSVIPSNSGYLQSHQPQNQASQNHEISAVPFHRYRIPPYLINSTSFGVSPASNYQNQIQHYQINTPFAENSAVSNLIHINPAYAKSPENTTAYQNYQYQHPIDVNSVSAAVCNPFYEQQFIYKPSYHGRILEDHLRNIEKLPSTDLSNSGLPSVQSPGHQMTLLLNTPSNTGASTTINPQNQQQHTSHNQTMNITVHNPNCEV